ncbi:TPA: DUF4097 family beta strand repeat protein [Streptococcus equi subsp. zooepidemicus]|uniref:DUF4097 family beta strand repeat-containing protein n=1 Tax=Streptococcus equi TaxID=1336 RepID=UPI0005B96B12|nr:DUF4097 family beta strand repeat-containing protein [Streptococcus equi]KIS09539.1 hypothetical protein AT51_00884 [Streptococcus equi subsp. zooepidemicus Sz57]MCD3391931.1 DUF4097 family beta strand repeat protein [Streptococcus equi subsp. zooepidemicus]MCD3395507.1 DUF4097 family beta strand repeat protein [Streptococcus equi subsp. zooepidemicus]MCD3436772.1 DUF4097 family beta strand repeat protein [Streptococcus equi subsp. zooepidemicus]MCD3449231.1 DUF4097 family beta strand repea
MTRAEYLAELDKYLRKLPKADYYEAAENSRQLELNEGRIKDSSITVADTKEENDYTEPSELAINHATIKGKNTINGGDININTTLANLRDIAYHVTTRGSIKLSSHFSNAKLNTDAVTGATSFHSDIANAVNQLDITVNKGDLSIH